MPEAQTLEDRFSKYAESPAGNLTDRFSKFADKSPEEAKTALETAGLPVTPEGVEQARTQAGPQYDVTVPPIGAPIPSVAEIQTRDLLPDIKPMLSEEHEAQRQRDFMRRFGQAQKVWDAAETRRRQALEQAPQPTIPEEVTEPISRKVFGTDLATLADRVFPETQNEGVVRGMTRRFVRTGAGVLDWFQSPEFLASAALEAATGGAATPFLATLMGGQFATQAGKQALKGLEDIRKNGITPENSEQFLQGLSLAALISMGPAAKADKAFDRATVRRQVAAVARSKDFIERAKYYADQGAIEKETERTVGNQPVGSAFQPRTADEVQQLEAYNAKQAAKARPNQAARRATLEVPETTVPEEQHFTDEELEQLTRAETPVVVPRGTEPAPLVERFAKFAPETKTEAPVKETPSPEPERVAAAQPAAQGGLDFETAQNLVDKIDDINKSPVRAKEPELVRDAEFNKFANDIRNVYQAIAPERVGEVEAATQLYDQGKPKEAITSLEFLKQEAHDIGKRNVEEGMRKAGIEIPEEEPAREPASKPRAPRAPKPLEEPTTPRGRIIREGAEFELRNWLDAAENLREAREAERNAISMESNVAGKEIEEEQVKRGTAIRSLGAKENTPLADFGETPKQLIEAARKGSGKLYQRMIQAFDEAYEKQYGEMIDAHLEQHPEADVPGGLFASQEEPLTFEPKPLETPSVLGQTEQEGLTKLTAGRPIAQLKEGKAFDEEGLVKSELFGGRGGRQGFLTGEGELAGPEEGDTGFNFARTVEARSLQELGQSGADAARAVRQGLRGAFAPVNVAESAAKMGLIVRRGAADLAARDARAARALQGARRYFSKLTEPLQLQFIDAVESGDLGNLPPLEQGFARTMRQLLDTTWEGVRQRAGVNTVIDNYFPHLWADPARATEVIRKFYARRPLMGGKAFLKQRQLMSVREGIEQGLELAMKNPVDMVLAQLHQENKFVTGHDMVEEMKQLGVIQFRSVFDKRPAGEKMVKINDPIGTVYGPPTVKVKEAYDEIMFDQLNNFARSLGIDHFRQVNIGRHSDTWGYTKEGTNKIFTKVGGPETVLTHEIGHQLDYRYGLRDQLTKKGETAKELRALADLRYAGHEDFVDPAYKKYVRQGSEKIANLIHAMIHAPELAEQVAPQSVQAVRELATMNPELRSLLDVKPSLVIGEAEHPMSVGGMVIKGYWHAPEPAARIINNYLGPGLAGNTAYDFMRATGNLLNQVQLGASAFHFTFTALDSASSMFSSGLQDVMSGRIRRGAARMVGGNIAVAPWYTAIQGSRILKEFYDQGSQGEYYGKVANDLIKAGGRAEMDFVYKNNSVEKFFDAWGKKDFIGAGFRAIPAAIEYAAKPIMEYWVPRQKLGAFAMLSQQMLEDLPAGADDILVRKTLSRAWDAIDDRMGQLVYDNLFWSRATKDAGMIAVRSLGWNLGTWRHFGGAAVDLAQALRGKGAAFETGRFKITPRMAYTMTFPIVIGLHGALAMYLMSGKRPQELKDYFFPQTGKVSPTGEPERVSLPSYAKDLYAYSYDFPSSTIQAFQHKIHPDLSVIADMLNNKDFYGTEIRHQDDPYLQQFKDAMEYIGKQYVPFSARNLAQRLQTKGVMDTLREAGKQPGTAAGSFFGIVPAPKSLEQTPAERLAAKYAAAERPEGGRTKVQFERAQARNAIIRAYQAKDPTAASQLAEARRSGKITPSDQALIVSERNQPPMRRYLRSANLEQLLNVWDQANPQEKRVLRPMIAARRGSQALTPEQRRSLLPRASRALGEPR